MDSAWLPFDVQRTMCAACTSEPVQRPGEWCARCNRDGNKPIGICPEHIARLAAQHKREVAEINLVRTSLGYEPLDA